MQCSVCGSTVKDNAPERQSQGAQQQLCSQSTSIEQVPPDPEARIAEAVARGATMEEIAELREPIATTPEEAVRELKRGNARFFSGMARRPELSALERRAQILAQTPFAVILGCADSRVPTEIIFDQGLGNLFVTRVAGNTVMPSTVGSIEYAIEHLKSHAVVVMGHEGCGAVKAAMLSAEDRRKEPKGIQAVLDTIVPAVGNLPDICDEKARLREAVIANVRLQVHNLRQNPTIKAAIERNQIAVVGAYYGITSGAVDFLETEEELRRC